MRREALGRLYRLGGLGPQLVLGPTATLALGEGDGGADGEQTGDDPAHDEPPGSGPPA